MTASRRKFLRENVQSNILRQAFLFCLVGVANTIVGLSVIFALMWLGLGDVLANMIGYAAGFCLGYLLNTRVTFNSQRSRSGATKYVLLMLICYCLNLAVMLFLRDAVGIDRHVAQIAGMITYTSVGFIGSRFFVFRAYEK